MDCLIDLCGCAVWLPHPGHGRLWEIFLFICFTWELSRKQPAGPPGGFTACWFVKMHICEHVCKHQWKDTWGLPSSHPEPPPAKSSVHNPVCTQPSFLFVLQQHKSMCLPRTTLWLLQEVNNCHKVFCETRYNSRSTRSMQMLRGHSV